MTNQELENYADEQIRAFEEANRGILGSALISFEKAILKSFIMWQETNTIPVADKPQKQ